MDNIYHETKNKPTDYFGVCPECGCRNNKIIFGCQPHYTMVCEEGHQWETSEHKVPRITILDKRHNKRLQGFNEINNHLKKEGWQDDGEETFECFTGDAELLFQDIQSGDYYLSDGSNNTWLDKDRFDVIIEKL